MKIAGKVISGLIGIVLCIALVAILGAITGQIWLIIGSPIGGVIAFGYFVNLKAEDRKKDEALVAQKITAGIPLTNEDINTYNKMIERAGGNLEDYDYEDYFDNEDEL